MRGILCCGNIVEDILVRPVDEVVFDTTKWVESISMSFGGNGSNTAYAAALMGAPVRLVSFTGADETGERVIAAIAKSGADMSRVTRVTGQATASTVVVINSSAARAFLHSPGVSRVAFREGVEFTPALVDGFSHFHLGNPFALVEVRPRAARILADARNAGLTTSLDAGWDARGQWLEVIGPCLPHTGVLFLNADEARMLSGHEDPREAGKFFLERGTQSVVIKLGARGCLILEPGSETAVPAFRVPAVDSTGAGDSFAGAFLAGLYHGLRSNDAARLANAAGALSVGSVGATTGLLNYEKTREWMAAHE